MLQIGYSDKSKLGCLLKLIFISTFIDLREYNVDRAD